MKTCVRGFSDERYLREVGLFSFGGAVAVSPDMTLMCLERVRPEPGERKPAG
jgi:hypothetical protein